MTPHTVIERLNRTGVVAILRGDFAGKNLLRVAQTIATEGIESIELTLNSADAFGGLKALVQEFGEDVLVGAGTVRSADGAQRAIDAGAQFLVSPHFARDVSGVALSSNTLLLPGVFTATEAQTAFAAGHSILKLFPADLGGPSYMRSLMAPLDDARFIPTGGVGPENARDYIAAGAVAVGVGGGLTRGWPDADAVADAARQILQAVRVGRVDRSAG